MSRRRRSLRLALCATAIAVLSMTTAAWALGELSQKPGAAGCFGGLLADACAEGRLLKGAEGVTVSPDGRNVYVAADGFDAILLFDRDPATGALTQKPGMAGCISKAGEGCQKGLGLDAGVGDVAVSPDGRNVYLAAGNGVAIFDRDPAGSLTQKPGMDGCIGRLPDCLSGRALFRADSIAISPDGMSVYLGSADAVAVFDRDREGKLTQKPGLAGCVGQGEAGGPGQPCLEGRGLEVVNDVTVSPDGRSVYAVTGGADSIAILDRQPDGSLSQKPGEAGCLRRILVEGCGPVRRLEEARAVAVSPDGGNVYVAAERDSDVAIFDRRPDGSLTQKPGAEGCVSSLVTDCLPARSLAPDALSISADGQHLYVASVGELGVAIFERDAAGGLTQKPGTAGCISASGLEGCERGRGMHDPFGIATSPDGKSVYAVSSQEPGALAIFDRAVPPPPPDTLAPGVSRFKLAPARFRVRSKRGTSFRFALTEPASVRISIERLRPRRRVTTLAFSGRAQGANRIRFRGRIRRRALKPGKYRATIVATDAAGNRSVPRRAGFRVLPAGA